MTDHPEQFTAFNEPVCSQQITQHPVPLRDLAHNQPCHSHQGKCLPVDPHVAQIPTARNRNANDCERSPDQRGGCHVTFVDRWDQNRIGYPADDARVPDLERKPLAEVAIIRRGEIGP